MKHPESFLQSNCVRWFRYEYPRFANLLFSIPNGGKRNVITASILKREGAIAGVSDMFLSIPSSNGLHGLYIEFKSGKNNLTPAQTAFKQAVEEVGYGFTICRSFDDFRLAAERHLSGEIVRQIYKNDERGTWN